MLHRTQKLIQFNAINKHLSIAGVLYSLENHKASLLLPTPQPQPHHAHTEVQNIDANNGLDEQTHIIWCMHADEHRKHKHQQWNQ